MDVSEELRQMRLDVMAFAKGGLRMNREQYDAIAHQIALMNKISGEIHNKGLKLISFRFSKEPEITSDKLLSVGLNMMEQNEKPDDIAELLANYYWANAITVYDKILCYIKIFGLLSILSGRDTYRENLMLRAILPLHIRKAADKILDESIVEKNATPFYRNFWYATKSFEVKYASIKNLILDTKKLLEELPEDDIKRITYWANSHSLAPALATLPNDTVDKIVQAQPKEYQAALICDMYEAHCTMEEFELFKNLKLFHNSVARHCGQTSELVVEEGKIEVEHTIPCFKDMIGKYKK